MIDKFNFYDIYGYFIPGAALLLLLWLPFGLIRGVSPPSDLGSAVIGAVVSYVAGHILHMICTRVLPSTILRGGRPRKPSDIVVDDSDPSFTSEFKTNLAALVQKEFSLDLQIKAPPTRDIDRVRGDAFNLARHALQHAKEVSYAEQLQGMYTLSRGLTASFGLACVYYSGWALSICHQGWVVNCIVIVVITVMLLTADNLTGILWKIDAESLEKIPEERVQGDKLQEQRLKEEKQKQEKLRKNLEKGSAGALLLAVLAAGYLLGRHFQPAPMKTAILAFCAMATPVASFRCFMAYKSFSFSFATTVWRDFYSSIDKEKPLANDNV